MRIFERGTDAVDRMRNPLAQHVNYGFLDGLIPSYSGFILPSNIDGVLERRGFFLVFEWKRKDERLSRGQEILLRNMAALAPFTVLLVTGHASADNVEVGAFHTFPKSGSALVLRGEGVDELKAFILKWWNAASASR